MTMNDEIMTINECKRDAARRLSRAGVSYTRITARTVCFSDLARGDAVFVRVHNPDSYIGPLFDDVPPPSKGGYMVETAGSVQVPRRLVRLPDRSLPYIINGNSSGYDSQDIRDMGKWMEDNPGTLSRCYPDQEPYCCAAPEFGLPATVLDFWLEMEQ